MRENPLITVPYASRALGVSYPTAASGLKTLANIGIVQEITGRGRDRVFVYRDYLDLLNEGTELPAGPAVVPG